METAKHVQSVLEANLNEVHGHTELKTFLLTALFAEGHVLVADYPGSDIKVLARILSDSIQEVQPQAGVTTQPFHRVYCTEHTRVKDIFLGSNEDDGEMLSIGLLLENFGLMPERVQAMLAAAMTDGGILIDGSAQGLTLMNVIACQDLHDRSSWERFKPYILEHFMLKLSVDAFKSADLNYDTLLRTRAESPLQIARFEELTRSRREIHRGISITEEIVAKLKELMEGLEGDNRLLKNGWPSKQAMRDFMRASQAYAFLHNEEVVTWTHIRKLACPALAHRIRCKISTLDSPEKILDDCFNSIDGRSLSLSHTKHPQTDAPLNWTLDDAARVYRQLEENMNAKIFGRDCDDEEGHSVSTVELILIALFSGGHLLLEDYPGSGKSYLAKTLGHSIKEDALVNIHAYQRIQCTPDLLPSDITGYMMWHDGRMLFRQGPIFTHVALADEINRTPQKVQSALLEAMAEKQVTVDEHTYQLGDCFFLIATQNPLDRKGTFELPHAQLDRFLFKRNLAPLDNASIKKVLSTELLQESKTLPQQISITELLKSRELMLKSVSSYIGHHDIRDMLPSIREAFTRRYDLRNLSEKERWQWLKTSDIPSARTQEAFLRALKIRACIRTFKNGSSGQTAPEIEVDDIRILVRDLLRHRIMPKKTIDPQSIPDQDVEQYKLLEDKIIVKAVREGIEKYIQQ